MKAHSTLCWFPVAVVALFALACDGDKPPSRLGLLPAENKTAATDAETERLRKLERITVLDPTTKAPRTISDEEFNHELINMCSPLEVCDHTGNSSCFDACIGRAYLCQAKTMLALTKPQGALVTVGQYQVPRQTDAATKTLAALGQGYADLAAGNFNAVLRVAANLEPSDGACDAPADEYTFSLDGEVTHSGLTAAEFAGAGFADAYDTYKQLGEQYMQAALNFSDAELNSDQSVARATRLALRQRLDASAELGGEVNKLGSDKLPRGTLCTRSVTTPAVQAAVAVIRDAAPAPEDLLQDESHLSTLNLIEGIGSAVTFGSVRQRLAEFYWGALDPATGATATLPNGKSVEEQYSIDLPTFTEARLYLQDEFTAFARSATAKLKRRLKPNGTLATYESYAATGSKPQRVPPAYYGALVRVNTTENAVFGPQGIFPTPSNGGVLETDTYNFTVPAYIYDARDIVDARYKPGSVLSDRAVGPLTLLSTNKDYLGYLTAEFTSTGKRFISVFGLSSSADGIKLALDDDDLRCAVQGNVEGENCTLAGKLLELTDFDPTTGRFSNALYDRAASAFVEPTVQHAYLLRPKAPAPTSCNTDGECAAGQVCSGGLCLLSCRGTACSIPDPVPGSYEALLGFNPAPAPDDPDQVLGGAFPIIRGSEERLAALLEPGRDWCTRPRVSCSGGTFDERIALENELTDDGNGFEDSWRHYLDLAKSAAAEADALGQDYINEALASAENQVSNERADQQQIEQANAQLQQLQQLCGFTSDTDSLLKKFTDPTTGAVINVTGPRSCGGGRPHCEDGYTCQGYQPGVRAGTCVLNLDAYIKDHDSDPDIKRIEDCLNPPPGSKFNFVSIGNVPVCLWFDPKNPNLVCKEPDGSDAPRDACPQILAPERAQALSAGGADLESTDDFVVAGVYLQCLAQLAGVQPASTALAVSRPLGYFSVDQDPASAGSNDVNLERIRELDHGSTWNTYAKRIIRSNDLDPIALEDTIQGLGWQSGFDDYAAITLAGADLYTTGNGLTGPPSNASTWPCGDDDKPWKGNPHDAARPSHYDCSKADGRRNAHVEMFKALAAAKVLGDLRIYDKDGQDGSPLVPFSTVQTDIRSADDGHVLDCVNCDSTKTLTRPGPNPTHILEISCSDGTDYLDATTDQHCFKEALLHGDHLDRVFTSLKGLSSANPGDGWLLDYLSGTTSALKDRVGYYDWGSSAAHIPGAVGTSLTITGTDVLMGVGLLMKAQQVGAALVSFDHPPAVKTVGDLDGVSQYIKHLAAKIRNSTSSLVFANVPAKVVDALRTASAAGPYPGFGGDMANQLGLASNALIAIRENGPLLANEVDGLASDIHHLTIVLKQANIEQQIQKVQLASQVDTQLAACAEGVNSLLVTGGAGTLGAIAACANSIAQIGFAQDIAALSKQNAELQGELAIGDFGAGFAKHSTQMQTLASQLLQGANNLDVALAAIESNSTRARSALLSALREGSFQAQSVALVTNALGNLTTVKQQRYSNALENAKRLSFVAKRAIEQRLAVRLGDISDSFPLVDAPNTWEATNCELSGIDFNNLSKEIKDNANAPQGVGGGFIGDYVRKLENFVESYTLQENFHEGTDTAVVSLKDDIMNVRRPCMVGTQNILYNAGQLDEGVQPGWQHENCPTQTVAGVDQPVPDCIDATKTATGPIFSNASEARTTGYSLTFGSVATATSAIVQSVALPAGLFRFSWYTQETGTTTGSGSSAVVAAPWHGGAAAGLIEGDVIPTIVEDGVAPATSSADWNRRFIIFQLDSAATVRVGFGKAGGSSITISAPMLEQLQDLSITTSGVTTLQAEPALTPFVNTTSASRNELLPACEDDDGSVFRSTRWQRGCVQLCADGFADHCTADTAKDYCYWEATFGFSQRDIQQGKLFNFSGFARGNFNYRIDTLGLNFVGTQPHDCANAASPQTCYAAGFIPYSIAHLGPFFVRNHKGADVEVKLFDGHIEHARGLATERYLTNPLSQTDDALVTQYLRPELTGRPLDGNFAIRIWDEQGVNFEAIQDVQLVLNYRYWTKFD